MAVLCWGIGTNEEAFLAWRRDGHFAHSRHVLLAILGLYMTVLQATLPSDALAAPASTTYHFVILPMLIVASLLIIFHDVHWPARVVQGWALMCAATLVLSAVFFMHGTEGAISPATWPILAGVIVMGEVLLGTVFTWYRGTAFCALFLLIGLLLATTKGLPLNAVLLEILVWTVAAAWAHEVELHERSQFASIQGPKQMETPRSSNGCGQRSPGKPVKRAASNPSLCRVPIDDGPPYPRRNSEHSRAPAAPVIPQPLLHRVPSGSPKMPPTSFQIKLGTLLLCRLDITTNDPSEIQRLSESFLREVDAAACACEGIIHSMDIDNAMISWNLSEDHPRHELAGCRCALALEKAVEERVRRSCKIAVVTASFVVGTLDIGSTHISAVCGRHCTIARQVLGLTAQLRSNILVSEAVQEASRDISGFTFLDSIALDGVPGSIKLYGRSSASPMVSPRPPLRPAIVRTPRMWGPPDINHDVAALRNSPFRLRIAQPRRCSVDSDLIAAPELRSRPISRARSMPNLRTALRRCSLKEDESFGPGSLYQLAPKPPLYSRPPAARNVVLPHPILCPYLPVDKCTVPPTDAPQATIVPLTARQLRQSRRSRSLPLNLSTWTVPASRRHSIGIVGPHHNVLQRPPVHVNPICIPRIQGDLQDISSVNKPPGLHELPLLPESPIEIDFSAERVTSLNSSTSSLLVSHLPLGQSFRFAFPPHKTSASKLSPLPSPKHTPRAMPPPHSSRTPSHPNLHNNNNNRTPAASRQGSLKISSARRPHLVQPMYGTHHANPPPESPKSPQNESFLRREYTTLSDVGLISEDQLDLSMTMRPSSLENAVHFTTFRRSGVPKQWYCSQTVIGSGGFGDVHFGMGERGTLVAIKRMAISSEKTAQLMNEIVLLSELRHEHIVAYLGSAVVDGYCMVIMEYVCTSLAKVLANFGQLEVNIARPYIKDITEGLHFLHQRDIIHRDLKPQNVLMQQNGVCKLADFGTATLLHKTQTTGLTDVIGTPHYMAPEAVWGYVGKEADVWALGVTLWEMLTGQLLIDCTQQVAVMFRLGVMTEDPQIPQDLDRHAVDFLKACLCLNHKNRYCTEQLMRMPLLRARR